MSVNLSGETQGGELNAGAMAPIAPTSDLAIDRKITDRQAAPERKIIIDRDPWLKPTDQAWLSQFGVDPSWQDNDDLTKEISALIATGSE